MPNPLTNHVNDRTVAIAMPSMNLSVARSISEMPELQVAHLYSVGVPIVSKKSIHPREGIRREESTNH
jgi:hypothetical protein